MTLVHIFFWKIEVNKLQLLLGKVYFSKYVNIIISNTILVLFNSNNRECLGGFCFAFLFVN